MSDTSATGPDAVSGPTPDTALRAADGPMLAADGTPLKRSLNRALRAQKMRALLLIAPLLIFILVTFVAPIADMLFRSVENQIVSETLPRTVVALEEEWDDHTVPPNETVYAAMAYDLVEAAERRQHTRLGSRLNYETTGISSLFRRSGRGIDDVGESYAESFIALDPAWEEPATWTALMASETWREEAAVAEANGDDLPRFETAEGIEAFLPETASAYAGFANTIIEEDGDSPEAEEPWNPVYLALYRDLTANPERIDEYRGPESDLLRAAAEAAQGFESVPVIDQFEEIDDGWLDPEVWGTIAAFSGRYTAGYYLAAADLQLTPEGVERQPPDQRIYLLLFKRTLIMSLTITGMCILLGYPVAFLLANLPLRTSNLLMILVLLPFWTSLLVRTSAWKVLLQQEGVINDILVWIGVVADGDRLQLINNQLGTIIAMTHILLPFMILPLYSVMKTVPPSYVRAARSLGATDWTAFWRVYFPQSVPGIGAGSILVFILAIGYYITPELVGGRTGTFISNRIAYHISDSLNWGLGAALGAILLGAVLVLYWTYDRIVGIDNVKLG
ncbi:ABC transporter permease subunit [Rhodobacterales bacterium HKCCE2091]|nr:ABC transporter permease subunit [Rhodobacterales bacterium HKCCE2091]